MRARYASRPPQVSIMGAVRSGHVLLLVVCMVSLLDNVLAVGLGGLFNEETTRKSYPVHLQFVQPPQFDIAPENVFTRQGRANDNWFAVTANITLNNGMPPWVAPEYYFQPFTAVDSSSRNSTETFDGRTRGYGLAMACEEMKPSRRIGEVNSMDFRPWKERNGVSGPGSGCPDFFNRKEESPVDGIVYKGEFTHQSIFSLVVNINGSIDNSRPRRAAASQAVSITSEQTKDPQGDREPISPIT